MKEITLKILAKDIMESSYSNPDDCAIARAVERLKLPISFGIKFIYTNDTKIDIGKLDEKVRQMYAFKQKESFNAMEYFPTIEKYYNVEKILEPADFDYTLTI